MGLEVTNFIPDTHIAWVEWDDETSFELQYVGTDEVEAVLMEKAQRASVRSQNATPGDRSKMMIDYLADAVITDWKGVEMNKKPLPFNRDNVIKV